MFTKYSIILYIFHLIIVNAQHVEFVDESDLTLDSYCRSRGFEGSCKHFKDCPIVTREFPEFSPSLCYMEGRDPIVCCRFEEKVRYRFVSRNSSDRRLINLCYEHYANKPGTDGLICDFREQCRPLRCILPSHGEIAPVLNHMYIGTLGWKSNDGTFDFRCGGSLIANNFILTAAHCLRTKPDIVRLGDKVYSENSEDIAVTQAFIHPDYDPQQVYHDIAILKLDRNASDKFELICLWTEHDVAIQNLAAIGFGATTFGGDPTDTLYKVNLNIMEKEVCDFQFPQDNKFSKGLIKSQMCAGDPNGKMDTCQGDSGGPLFNTIELTIEPECTINQRVAHLVGITSFGQVCGESVAGVYTRVSQYIDWIESIVFTKQ